LVWGDFVKFLEEEDEAAQVIWGEPLRKTSEATGAKTVPYTHAELLLKRKEVTGTETVAVKKSKLNKKVK
jgi:hypothetical protein